MSPFHYFPGDRLSLAELMAACLDGHLVELGEGFMPADAAETPWMRARSLVPLLGTRLAATHTTAAWIHGALADVPWRVDVQRASARRIHAVHNRRLVYRDLRLDPEDTVLIASVAVSSVQRTIADLARSPEHRDALDAMLTEFPAAAGAALTWFEDHPRYPGARSARATLRAAVAA